MIHLESVSCAFEQQGREPFYALRELDLRIETGETVALLGPSGCGKTTTLRLINRLLEPTAGRVVVDERDTGAVDPVQLRRGMGYVIQSGGLFPHMNVRRNVGLLLELEGRPAAEIDERVDELLELVRLDASAFRHRYPAELSGGQRQRIGVARALALDPPILLMDEPFGALDPITRGELQRDFQGLERLVEKTVVLVSHDLDEAFLLADRVALLKDGTLQQLGTPDEMQSSPASEWVRSFVGERHG